MFVNKEKNSSLTIVILLKIRGGSSKLRNVCNIEIQ